MKKILGFDSVNIAKCDDCGAIFSYDPDQDVEKLNINNKKECFLSCPNCDCENSVKKTMLITTEEAEQYIHTLISGICYD